MASSFVFVFGFTLHIHVELIFLVVVVVADTARKSATEQQWTQLQLVEFRVPAARLAHEPVQQSHLSANKGKHYKQKRNKY